MYNITELECREWYPNFWGRVVIKIGSDEVWLTKGDLKEMLEDLEEDEGVEDGT